MDTIRNELNFDNVKDWFELKVQLACDPYYEREFFTNLIYCIDRKKSIREVFEEAVLVVDRTGEYSDDVDRALNHLFTAYQTTSHLRESYQWLPIFQGIFGLALARGDASKPLAPNLRQWVEPRGSNIDEFTGMLKREARRVVSFEKAWGSLLFLIQNRTLRSKALEVLVSTCIEEADTLTASLLTRAVDLSFASGWRSTEVLLRRAFERFWFKGLALKKPLAFTQGLALLKSSDFEVKFSGGTEWKADWSAELWHRVSKESAESAWEWMRQISSESASLDQLVTALDLMRGRCLYTMKSEQWPFATRSLSYSTAIASASRWIPQNRKLYLAANLSDVVKLAQMTGQESPRPTSIQEVPKAFSENLGKNQLVLRLDDVVERGERDEAFGLLSLIGKDKVLTQSVTDRFLLMASKQDSWTYEYTTLGTALTLTQAYLAAERIKLPRSLANDGIFGLLRYLCDQRQAALAAARGRGNYGDGGLYKSPFDVSGGARIVERYVFNQLRNAQRIQIWPSEGKG